MEESEAPYGEKLKIALECDGWSLNRLAKELAGRTGNAVETERSAIRGYLKGSSPRPERAELIADIMGMPELETVENPRLSGAGRVELRLESLARTIAETLENQQRAMATQEEILDELRSLHEALDIPREGGRSDPKPSHRQAQ